MLKAGSTYTGVVVGAEAARFKHRWFGILEVIIENEQYKLFMSGTISQWFSEGNQIKIKVLREPKKNVLEFSEYVLWKEYGGEYFQVWPPFKKDDTLPRKDPVTGSVIYEYRLRFREAMYESDFEAIAELEQYHYASKKVVVAIWRCEKCGTLIRSNTKPICPKCGTDKDVHILEIRGSTPASRFMVVELLDRQPYEPKIVAYVRIDPPVPLMHRKMKDGKIIKNIREKVFPKDWFEPSFWPEVIYKAKLKELRGKYVRSIARSKLWEEAKWKALRTTNTAAARIARVVVHPDYRSDGIGQKAVKVALEWVSTRRIPEMKKPKHVVETIAQMARYNPFFEKVGFKYLWDTASGRPVLYFPLTKQAEKIINEFLKTDPEAKIHKGKLCISRFGKVDPIDSPIVLENVTKVYESFLSLSNVDPLVRRVLEAFGVRERKIQRLVLRSANITINPREIIVVVGASGAGKTTLLRLIYGAIKGLKEQKYTPTSGDIRVPKNAKLETLIPGEIEPDLSGRSILENIVKVTDDDYLAVEILNRAGISDAVLFRARYEELSTGQKMRAQLARLLASRPNIMIIDEFAAHLDALTAMRVARKLSELARSAGITLIIVTHRREVIRALHPDKIIFVGYGIARIASREEYEAIVGSS